MQKGRIAVYGSYGILAMSLLCAPPTLHAQEPASPASAAQDSSPDAPEPTASAQPTPEPSHDGSGKTGSRIFGVLPNYTTVEGATRIDPISPPQKFHMFAQGSFDPFVFPYIGVVAALGPGQGTGGYLRRYAMAFADNSIGNFMTTAVVPSALHQDPRYFQLGHGGLWHRAGYALSRTVVTRGDAGGRQFNLSEVGGNFIGAGISNLYYPAGARSVTNTLTRWGTQVLGDALAFELKEFWPDIHRMLHKRPAAPQPPLQ